MEEKNEKGKSTIVLLIAALFIGGFVFGSGFELGSWGIREFAKPKVVFHLHYDEGKAVE